MGLSIMLRTYFVQQWFNLSDPGAEEAMYESAALRRFVGVDLGMAPAPDERMRRRSCGSVIYWRSTIWVG